MFLLPVLLLLWTQNTTLRERARQLQRHAWERWCKWQWFHSSWRIPWENPTRPSLKMPRPYLIYIYSRRVSGVRWTFHLNARVSVVGLKRVVVVVVVVVVAPHITMMPSVWTAATTNTQTDRQTNQSVSPVEAVTNVSCNVMCYETWPSTYPRRVGVCWLGWAFEERGGGVGVTTGGGTKTIPSAVLHGDGLHMYLSRMEDPGMSMAASRSLPDKARKGWGEGERERGWAERGVDASESQRSPAAPCTARRWPVCTVNGGCNTVIHPHTHTTGVSVAGKSRERHPLDA